MMIRARNPVNSQLYGNHKYLSINDFVRCLPSNPSVVGSGMVNNSSRLVSHIGKIYPQHNWNRNFGDKGRGIFDIGVSCSQTVWKSDLSVKRGWVEGVSKVRRMSTVAMEGVVKEEKGAEVQYEMAPEIVRLQKLRKGPEPLPHISFREDPRGYMRVLPAHAWETLKQYYSGTVLLFRDIRTVISILNDMTKGHKMTRRQRKQLIRTFTDLLRVIPFSVFVIVPFLELTLPFFLKVFPEMLPSTFEGVLEKEEKAKRRLKARIELAKFLQDTISELPSPEARQRVKEQGLDFNQFMHNVRSGAPVAREDVVKFATLLRDEGEFDLSSVPRPQLQAVCRYMGLPTFGPPSLLRFQLDRLFRAIKREDQRMFDQGASEVPLTEVQDYMRARGMKGSSYSRALLVQRANEWAHLSIAKKIPIYLLILSRTLLMRENKDQELKPLLHTISQYPDDLLSNINHHLSLDLQNAPPEYHLKSQAQQQPQPIHSKQPQTPPQLQPQQDIKEQPQEQPVTQQPKLVKDKEISEDKLKEFAEAVSILASKTGVEPERMELNALKAERDKAHKEEDVLTQKVTQIKQQMSSELSDSLTEIKKSVSQEAKEEAEEAVKSNQIIKKLGSRLDKMVEQLEKEISSVEENVAGKLKVIDQDNDGVISAKELSDALSLLKEKLDVETVEEVVSMLDADHDGKISVNELLRYATDEENANSEPALEQLQAEAQPSTTTTTQKTAPVAPESTPKQENK